MGDRRDAYRDFIRRPDGNIPLGRPRRRLKNSIKVYLQKYRLGRYRLDCCGSG